MIVKDNKTYDDVRRSVATMKMLQEAAGSDEMNGIPYTQEDSLWEKSVEAAKSQFSADFSKVKNPLIYYRNDDDITLSGEIGGIEGAKFQFRFKEQDGCYIWLTSVHLNDATLRTLQTINGFYKNWRDDIGKNIGDCKPMSLQNEQR